MTAVPAYRQSATHQRPCFPYLGSKVRLAPWIVSHMPPHRAYVEPFAGSAAVLLAKPPATHEILNDADGNVVAFFRVLRDRPEDLLRLCTLTPYARDEFEAARLDVELDDLERARRFWVRTTQSFGKSHRENTGWSTTVRGGNHNGATRARSLLTRFENVARRIARTEIENADAVEVILRNDGPDTVIYVDPPYLASTRSVLTKRNGDYRTEMGSEAEHRRLAEALVACRSTVLLSGYDSALYRDLYPDWWRLDAQVTSPTTNGHTAVCRRAKRTEVLWSNRPLAEQGRFDLT